MSVVIRRRSARVAALSIVLVLLAVLAAQVAWNALIAPTLLINKVVFDSDLNISDAQLLEMLDLAGESWTTIDENELSSRLESYPVVRKARVVKVFPDTLKLYLYRRNPLVTVLVEEDGYSIPAVFDEDGYAVHVGNGPGVGSLPILSGPEFSLPALGARLPESVQSVLADLSRLRDEDPRMFSLVSEMELVSRGGDLFDLRLYMNHIPIPVVIDHGFDAASVKRAVLVLDVLAGGNVGTVDEADIRGDEVVFRRSEES